MENANSALWDLIGEWKFAARDAFRHIEVGAALMSNGPKTGEVVPLIVVLSNHRSRDAAVIIEVNEPVFGHYRVLVAKDWLERMVDRMKGLFRFHPRVLEDGIADRNPIAIAFEKAVAGAVLFGIAFDKPGSHTIKISFKRRIKSRLARLSLLGAGDLIEKGMGSERIKLLVDVPS